MKNPTSDDRQLKIRAYDTYTETFTRGGRNSPPSFSARWVEGSQRYSIEMQKPRERKEFYVRLMIFRRESGERWSVSTVAEAELSPGETGDRSSALSRELNTMRDFRDVHLLDLIEHAARKIRPGLYHLGYAMARIEEVRRRLAEGTAEAISGAAQGVVKKAEERSDLRRKEDREITDEVEDLQWRMCSNAAGITFYGKAGAYGAQLACAEEIERTSRRIRLLEGEIKRRADLSSHERMAEAAQRAAVE